MSRTHRPSVRKHAPSQHDSPQSPSVPRRSSRRICAVAEPLAFTDLPQSRRPSKTKYLVPHPSEPGRYITAPMAVPNFSRVLTLHNKSHTQAGEQASVPSRTSSCKMFGVKRWNGLTRTLSDWDGLRRDVELWSGDADCLVHLYGKGRSRRGPSFRVSSKILKASQCGRLFGESYTLRSSTGSIRSTASVSDSGYSSGASAEGPCDIFIPAPDESVRTDAFKWHITTRNLFAWMMDKPLVGASLSTALIDLLERMLMLRSATINNVQDCLAYAERMGYLDFSHSPDYALALLRFAEHFQLRDLWIDAFSHCVGMDDSLCLSPEFDTMSLVTKALVTRSSLEMDLHLGRVTRALNTLLEDEMSSTYLGLANPERAHLDRFRSHLHSYYVAKYGYWPPRQDLTYGKDLLADMCDEFQKLYDYLVDRNSSTSMAAQFAPATGGLCVLQNVNAFDRRHNYDSLAHPLPLLPQCDHLDKKVHSQRSLRPLKLGGKTSKNATIMSARAAHLTASNKAGREVEDCPLVQLYISFEQDSVSRPDDKLTMTDARKVRWLMIYCTLQMLISVTKAPQEVRDPWSSSYHMCCLISDTPSFQNNPATPLSVHPALRSCEPSETSSTVSTPTAGEDHPDSPISIHPDCEGTDYFSHSHTRSNVSTTSLNPAPLRIVSPVLGRSSSFHALGKRMSTFSRRNSVRKSATFSVPASPAPAFDESQLASCGDPIADDQVADIQEARTPTLHSLMLDGHHELDMSAVTSFTSAYNGLDIPRTPSPLHLYTNAFQTETTRFSSSSEDEGVYENEWESDWSYDEHCDSPITPISYYESPAGKKRVGFVVDEDVEQSKRFSYCGGEEEKTLGSIDSLSLGMAV